jgi:hypothetical protein
MNNHRTLFILSTSTAIIVSIVAWLWCVYATSVVACDMWCQVHPDDFQVIVTVVMLSHHTLCCYKKKLNSVAFSPQANYTDRVTATCWRS